MRAAVWFTVAALFAALVGGLYAVVAVVGGIDSMQMAREQACDTGTGTIEAANQQVATVDADKGILLTAAAALSRWDREHAIEATALAKPESGWDPTAENPDSTAKGLWQTMMSLHAPKYDAGEHWSDPYDNAEVAHEIWVLAGNSFRDPWVQTYGAGKHLPYMDRAEAAVDKVLAGDVRTRGPPAADDGQDVQQAAAPVAECAPAGGRNVQAVVEWEPGDDEQVTVDGETVERHTAKMLRLAERTLGADIPVTQGSFSTGVAASGGTHDGGGVIDTGMAGSWAETVDALTQAGFIAWWRTPEQGSWNDHIHAIDPASPNLSPEAANQVLDWENGGDGLGTLNLTPVTDNGGGVAVSGDWTTPMQPGTYDLSNSFGLCGPLWSACHTGEDINGNPEGQPVYAVGSGKVTTSSFADGSYGYYVVIDHGGGDETWYAHLAAPSTLSVGDQVAAGDRVGVEGATGNVTGVHLHLEARVDGSPVDPIQFLADHGVTL